MARKKKLLNAITVPIFVAIISGIFMIIAAIINKKTNHPVKTKIDIETMEGDIEIDQRNINNTNNDTINNSNHTN